MKTKGENERCAFTIWNRPGERPGAWCPDPPRERPRWRRPASIRQERECVEHGARGYGHVLLAAHGKRHRRTLDALTSLVAPKEFACRGVQADNVSVCAGGEHHAAGRGQDAGRG